MAKSSGRTHVSKRFINATHCGLNGPSIEFEVFARRVQAGEFTSDVCPKCSELATPEAARAHVSADLTVVPCVEKVLIRAIAQRMVACYVAEQGAVPRGDQQRLFDELVVAIHTDVTESKRGVGLKDLNKRRIELLVCGGDEGEDPESVMLWPAINAVITRWSE